MSTERSTMAVPRVVLKRSTVSCGAASPEIVGFCDVAGLNASDSDVSINQ